MIFVATVHYKSARWIDVQLAYLRRCLDEPFRVYAVLDRVPGDHDHKVDRVVPAEGRLAGKLNLLAAEISWNGRPDDLIMFIDGDAFPVQDPMPTVRRALSETSLIAIRRDENLGDRQPHPSFCVVPVSEWERLHGDWSAGYPWSTSVERAVSDVGGNLLGILERTATPWTPLLRSNRVNLHPLWFGVYGDILYHHGAGFRPPISRLDASTWRPWERAERLPVLGGPIWAARSAHQWLGLRRRQVRSARRIGDRIYDKMKHDFAFYKEFL